MVAVNSTMLSLGTLAPSFSLINTVSGEAVALDSLPEAKGYLIIFMCNHCPFVKLLFSALGKVTKQLQSEGIEVVGICSNDVENYPDDAPEKMRELVKEQRFTFPYLFDEDQSVAKAYKAACTPDFFLFDSNKKLVYRGQFDDARPGNGIEPTGKDLLNAAEALLKGESIPEAQQKPSIGCNIKWIAGSEPDYFS